MFTASQGVIIVIGILYAVSITYLHGHASCNGLILVDEAELLKPNLLAATQRVHRTSNQSAVNSAIVSIGAVEVDVEEWDDFVNH